MTNTNNPLSYLGVRAQRPPNIITAQRAPAATDTAHDIGTIWIDQTAQLSYQLIVVTAGVPTWGVLSPGASDVDTINSLAPVAGNIIIDGGTNITDVNAGNTVTLNLDDAITLATSVTSPIFASAAAMAINPVGALTVTGGTTIDINAAAGQNITLQMGDAVGANVIDFEDSASATVASLDSNGTLTVVNMDGIIGATTPAAGTFTTATANTSVVSPLFTAAAADALIQAGGANDVVVRLGDNAGATFFRVQDSDSADVYTIDSNGTLAAMLGLTVTGALTQTAGAVSIAEDNAADAVGIAGGNVARAVTIASGAAAHTVTIGSAAAGAITVDTAAGFSIDGATASNVTVSGAGADLTMQSSAGRVVVRADEAAVDAVDIMATAGGIDIVAVTNDLDLTATAGSVVISGGEAIANAVDINTAAGGVDIDAALQINIDSAQVAADAVRIIASNAAGGIDIDAGTGGIAIASTGALDLDSDGASSWLNDTGDLHIEAIVASLTLQSGEAVIDAIQLNAVAGGIDINADGENCDITAASHSVHITSGEAIGDSILLNAVAGGIDITAAQDIDITATGTAVNIDAVGAVSLNSSGAAINIGNDADAFAVNIGTGAAARTVTVGSTNTTSATVIQSGTGEITMTGTVKQIDAELLGTTGVYIPTINMSPVMTTAATTGGAPTGGVGDTNLMSLQNQVIMSQFILGAGQTIIAPRMSANGLLISLDLTATEGAEYGFEGALDSTFGFTVGTSGAFFFELDLYINDMDGADPYIFGFRKTEANNATFADYTDYYALGMNAATSATELVIFDELNATGQTITNTTDLWGGDGTTNTLRIDVSAAGVCTSYINGVIATAAPAFTFDADRVTPFIRLTHSANPTQVAITGIRIGLQA